MDLDRLDVAAVVLAGGRATRLGGVDKTQLEVGGVRLLDRVLAAVPAPWPVVCVGPRRTTTRAVTWVRESPAGSGPASALGTGMSVVTSDVVAVLAADLPFLTVEVVTSLVNAVEEGSGVVATDADGRAQWLLSAWPADLLRRAIAGVPAGGSLHAVLGALRHARATLPASAAPPVFDCDAPTDLDLARRIHDAGRVGRRAGASARPDGSRARRADPRPRP